MSKVKLLIEIDEPVYIALKMKAEQKEPVCCTENAYLIQMVLNGIPITDDCISRDALKKDIETYDRAFAPDWVISKINNAPTYEKESKT